MLSRLDQHVRAISHLFVAHATYSPPKHALTISLPLAECLFNDHISPTSQLRMTFGSILTEGEKRRAWRCDFDRMSGIQLLVVSK